MPGIEIHPLELARIELPAFHPEAPGTDTVYGFIVRDAGDCVLVDTGVGRGSALIDRLYGPTCVDLSAALGSVGVSMSDVTAIVNSHLHFDHCGNNSLFPGVPIFVQEAELKASQEASYTVEQWVRFSGARYKPISGSRHITARIEVRPTPGHTPGHQSVVVHSGERVEVIVAQASYTAAEFDFFARRSGDRQVSGSSEAEGFLRSNATWSEDAYLTSIDALLRLRPSRAYFSHDPRVWSREA